MQMLEIQIFVGVVVILGAVFVALLCDFLKGNNEQLRERNIELTSRQDEREKLGIFQNPMEWMQNLVSALRQTPMAESMAGAGTPPPASRETEAFTPLRKNGESDIAAGEAEPPLRRRMYDEMKARSQQGPSWASKEELEQLAERAARIRARHEAHKTHDDKVKEDTATRLVEEVARQRETPESVEHSAAPEPLPVIVPTPVPEKAPVVLEKTPIVLEKPQVVPDIPAPVVEKAAPVVEKAPVVIEKAPVIIDKAPIVMERPPAPVEIKPPVVESAKVTPIKPPERPVERDLPSMPREQVIPSGPFAAAPAREPAPPAAPKPAPSLWDDEASEDEPPPVILSPASAVTGSRPALSLSIPAMPEPPAPPKPPAPEIIDEVARLKVLPIETIGLEPVPPPPPAPPSVELAFEPEPEPEPEPEVKPEPEAKPEPVERPVASVPSPPPPPPPVTLPVAAAAPVLQAQADPVEYDEVPAGLHEGSVLESLIERGLSFSGVAVAIGINDYASLKEKLAANSGADSLSALNRMVQSMLRPQDFACQFTEDEFILLYPGESGSSAQRRLFQVSEKLWDFQLRSLGHLSVMFSWGGLEVQNERLQEAVASARERMYQTRRNRKPGAGESAGARKRVANG